MSKSCLCKHSPLKGRKREREKQTLKHSVCPTGIKFNHGHSVVESSNLRPSQLDGKWREREKEASSSAGSSSQVHNQREGQKVH